MSDKIKPQPKTNHQPSPIIRLGINSGSRSQMSRIEKLKLHNPFTAELQRQFLPSSIFLRPQKIFHKIIKS